MPIKHAAIKALRKSKKNAVTNKRAKESLKDLYKKTLKAIEAGDEKAKELVKQTLKATDKMFGRKIMKKNTVARKKSRLMAKFNKKFIAKQKIALSLSGLFFLN